MSAAGAALVGAEPHTGDAGDLAADARPAACWQGQPERQHHTRVASQHEPVPHGTRAKVNDMRRSAALCGRSIRAVRRIGAADQHGNQCHEHDSGSQRGCRSRVTRAVRHRVWYARRGRGGPATARSVDAKASHDERPDLGDSLEVAVDMDDAEPVVQRRLGDQKVLDRRSVPHFVVMRKVALQRQRAIEKIVGNMRVVCIGAGPSCGPAPTRALT